MDNHSVNTRYSRQILFRPIGQKGQDSLASARVAIVGMGALGTASATQLVRAGVGFVRLIDRDLIEPSNLQRQFLYEEADAEAALPKAVAAAEHLRKANSAITIEPVVADLTWRNAESLLTDVDVIVDGTDNFEVRYLINDVAVKHQIPFAYGGAVSSYGTTAFLRPNRTPCLVCLFGPHSGQGHDTCDTIGVISPIVSVIASLQVTETLKYLTNNESALSTGLTQLDVWSQQFQTIAFQGPKSDCPCCVHHEFQSLEATSDALAVSFCGRRTIQVRPTTPVRVALDTTAKRLASSGEIRMNDHLLRCDLGDIQITLFKDGRALIHGVDDQTEARSIYARYIGM